MDFVSILHKMRLF